MSVRFVERLEDANVITHGGGTFHGDDIFGLVFLDQLLNGKVFCYRIPYNETSKLLEVKGKIVFDTGGGQFDHHQKGGNGNHELVVDGKNAIPNASFGLLWSYYGKAFIEKKYLGYDEDFYDYVFKYLDFHLVRSIDAADNGIFPGSLEEYPIYRVLSLSCIISFLNQEELVKDSENKGLELALRFARKAFQIILNRAVKSYKLKKSYFEVNNKKEKNDKYENIVYKALMAEMDKSGCFKNNKIQENQIKDYNTFDNSKISSLWNNRGEDYLKSINNTYWQHMMGHITAIINGFAADCLGLGCRINPNFDYMTFPTLGTVFASVEEYGERYEKDLKELFGEILKNSIKVAIFKAESKAYVEEKVNSTFGHILVFERKVYWQDWIASMPEAKRIWFVISPTDNGAWKVKPIPCKYNANGYKKGFPSKWFGYSKDNKEGYVKFNKGVEFIHASGFLAICDTLNSARNLAMQAMYNQENCPIEKEK